MRLSRRRFIAISAAASANMLLPDIAFGQAGIVRWSGIAMGASASLAIVGLPEDEAERLIDKVRTEIGRLETIFSLYRPDSAITRLNREGALEGPPFEFLSLLTTARAIHRATGGAFDPTVQPVWALLAQTRGAPDRNALARARALIGLDRLHADPQRVSFETPGMALTLNGIAQGYATDRVAALLKSAGFENILISIGEIAAIGRHGPNEPWQIGIAEHEDAEPEERIALENAAIATTAPRGTVLDPRDHTGHLVDPRQRTAASKWRRVSVINASATIADGLSTGFALMSAEAIRNALTQFPGSEVIAVSDSGLRLHIHNRPAGHNVKL